MHLKFVPQSYESLAEFIFPYLPNITIVRRLVVISAYPPNTISSQSSFKSTAARVRKEVWRHGTIRWIISNEKYIGDTLMQKSYSTDTLPYRSVTNRGEKAQYYVRETHGLVVISAYPPNTISSQSSFKSTAAICTDYLFSKGAAFFGQSCWCIFLSKQPLSTFKR